MIEHELIRARAAVEPVAPHAAVQRIVPRTTVKPVGAAAAAQRIVAVAAEQGIRTRSAG